MRRLFPRLCAVLLSCFLLFGFAPTARAASIAGLTPCAENPRFQQRAAAAQTDQAKARFELYSQAVCGTDGLPHLIVDGRWSHAGDFMIPGIAFLYIAGCIGWAGRNYLMAIRNSKDATMKEIQIDLPLAFKSTLAAASWPLAAFGELTSRKLTESENNITVSPR
jgi:photosystem I subunit 3